MLFFVFSSLVQIGKVSVLDLKNIFKFYPLKEPFKDFTYVHFTGTEIAKTLKAKHYLYYPNFSTN